MLTHLGTVPAARHGQGGGELQDIGLDARKGRTAHTTQRILRTERGLLAGRLRQGNYAGDYTDTVHLPDGRNDEAPKIRAFDRTADGRFVAYVPEYRNVAAGTANRKAADAAEMRVRFKEAPGKEYTVEFKYYNAPPEGSAVGDPFDIRRNYYYKFSISKTSEPDPS